MNNLLKIADNNFWNNINNCHKEGGGVYKIIGIHNNKRQYINRFLGVDKEGVLYIGKANSFIDRVIDLKKSLDPLKKSSAHICGRRYKKNPNIANQFPFESLYIDLIPSKSPEEDEKKMINEYVIKYGEVPPLNAI